MDYELVDSYIVNTVAAEYHLEKSQKEEILNIQSDSSLLSLLIKAGRKLPS